MTNTELCVSFSERKIGYQRVEDKESSEKEKNTGVEATSRDNSVHFALVLALCQGVTLRAYIESDRSSQNLNVINKKQLYRLTANILLQV